MSRLKNNSLAALSAIPAMLYMHIAVAVLVLCSISTVVLAQTPLLKVGSKKFTESVVLGEVIAQLAQSVGAQSEHLQEMGGTRILWNALLKGGIDVYPEYTGTIAQEILSGEKIDGLPSMRRALAAHDTRTSAPLGFNNTYAINDYFDIEQVKRENIMRVRLL